MNCIVAVKTNRWIWLWNTVDVCLEPISLANFNFPIEILQDSLIKRFSTHEKYPLPMAF